MRSLRARSTLAVAACVAVLIPVGSQAVTTVARSDVSLEYPGTGERVQIQRDPFGVPHVIASTDDGLAYGVGYAQATDRYFLMHMFKLVSHGHGGDVAPTEDLVQDDLVIRRLTYTPAERARWLEAMPPDVRDATIAYSDGVSAWIREANRDPAKTPFEMVELGLMPIPEWTADDTLAFQGYLLEIGIFAAGNEVEYAALLQRLVGRLGRDRGLAAFDDLIRSVDGDVATTVEPGVDWRRVPSGSRIADLAAYRTLQTDHRLPPAGEPGATTESTPAGDGVAVGTWAQLGLVHDWQPLAGVAHRLADQLERIRSRMRLFGSYAQLLAPAKSSTGNSLMAAGPASGFVVPNPYWEFGIHRPGLDAVGNQVPGLGPGMLIGRSGGTSWTLTNSFMDLMDVFVIALDPADHRRYRHGSTYEPLSCRLDPYSVRGVPVPEYDQEICRSGFGPVIAIDEATHQALVRSSPLFDRDWGIGVALWRFPRATSVTDFATAANFQPGANNFHYADDAGHIAVWTTGYHPQRVPGADPRLPQDASNGGWWSGLASTEDIPHMVDPKRGHLMNWNGPVVADFPNERVRSFRNRIHALTDLVEDGSAQPPAHTTVDAELARQNLERTSYRHHRGAYLAEALPPRGLLTSAAARAARDLLDAWDFSFRDGDGDGTQDHPGPVIVDEWFDVVRSAIFADDLGSDISFVTEDEVWHVLAPASTWMLGYDWTGDAAPAHVAAGAFETAVARLEQRFGTADPNAWRAPTRRVAYQRVNADLFTDAVLRAVCGAASCPMDTPAHPAGDSGVPGDIPDQVFQDRGSYQQIVQFLDSPQRQQGASRAFACSILSPGNDGFIDVAGRESEHYRDMYEMYVGWRFHDMPRTLDELAATRGQVRRDCAF